MARAYDPLPDIAAALTGMYFRMRPWEMPDAARQALVRLLDKLKAGPVPEAAMVELRLRALLEVHDDRS